MSDWDDNWHMINEDYPDEAIEEIKALKTRIKALEGVVEELVWCNRRLVPTDPALKGFDVIASLPYCRNCHATKEQGHAKKCWISKALKKLEEV